MLKDIVAAIDGIIWCALETELYTTAGAGRDNVTAILLSRGQVYRLLFSCRLGYGVEDFLILHAVVERGALWAGVLVVHYAVSEVKKHVQMSPVKADWVSRMPFVHEWMSFLDG